MRTRRLNTGAGASSRAATNTASSRYVSITALLNTAELRTASCDGVDYIVAPVVAMVGDSVVWPVNSDVPEFVPADVLSIAPEQWNNRPVCMGHPRVDDVYVSANTPEIIESWAYGRTFNARYDEADRKLKMEAWMSPAKAKLLMGSLASDAERVLERLANSEMIEVSIGAYITVEEVEGEYNGQEYGAMWLSVASDHLASLNENQRGACAIADGCGLLRVSTSKADSVLQVASILSQARTPTYSGTESTSWSAPTFADYIRYLHPGSDGPKSVSQCSADLKRRIASHSLLGDESANNIRELVYFPCVNPANGKLNEKALRAIVGSRGDNADIDSKAKASAQDMASRLLNSEFGVSGLIGVSGLQHEANRGLSEDNTVKPNMFSRMLAAIKDAMSGNQLRTRLYNALRDVEPHLSWIDDEDQEKGLVFYSTYSYSNDSYRSECWQRTFTLAAGTNNVTINDDRKKVEPVQRYEVVEEDETGVEVTVTESGEPAQTPCACHRTNQTQTTTQPQEETDMATAESLQKLTDALKNVGDDKIESLISTLQAPVAEASTTTSTTATAEPTVAASTPVVAATKPTTIDEWMAKPDVPEEVKTLVRSHQQKEAAYRTDLVTKLKTAAAAFTEDELKAMPTTQLEKLAKTVNVEQPSAAGLVHDYSAAAGSVIPSITANEASKVKLPDTWRLNAGASKAN